ncbi:threonine/serine exporter family protein [Microbacterium sediminicola]|uniref:Threonine/serine exporter family protein n=1 Tax=Microbacterium sediminicola TaxID=415210 RepID=A0ABN2IHC3_9MICO
MARTPRLLDRIRGALSAFRRPAQPVVPPTAEGLPEMLGEVGAALLAASQATSDVRDTLLDLAGRYGRTDLRVIVLPTLVMIEDTSTVPSHMSTFAVSRDPLRLDQAGALEQIVRRAYEERPSPAEVLAQVTEGGTTPPRFGAAVRVLGYALLTVGFGLVLNPTLEAIPVYVILGIAVGIIARIGTRFPTLALILPVATAFAVTVAVSLLATPLVPDDVLRLVAPALVSFLPGLTLTIAAVELTAGEVIAGASRMVYGIARLGLLAFGVFAGLTVADSSGTTAANPAHLGAWAPWLGIAFVSIGYYLYAVAPRRSLLWIAYALVVAYAAQLLGNLLLGAELSGLVGALLVIPAVQLAGRLRSAPPRAVMLTCAYWLLVPGAMGFIGVGEATAGASGAADTLVQTFVSLAAIAIGMMLGAGLTKDAAAVARGWKTGSST